MGFWENQFQFEHSSGMRQHHATSWFRVDLSFSLDQWTQLTHLFGWKTHHTHSSSFYVALASYLVDNRSKRLGEMPSGQVSGRSKPLRGLWKLKRNDAPGTMKANGRKEDNPGNTAWRNPMQPHPWTVVENRSSCVLWLYWARETTTSFRIRDGATNFSEVRDSSTLCTNIISWTDKCNTIGT